MRRAKGSEMPARHVPPVQVMRIGKDGSGLTQLAEIAREAGTFVFPLTTTPDAMAGFARHAAQRALDLGLRAWWALARLVLGA